MLQIDHFPAMSPREWGDEWEANYTKVVRLLQASVGRWDRMRLFLTLPFPLSLHELNNQTIVGESGLMERVQRVSSRLGVPLIDLSSSFAAMPPIAADPRRSRAPKDRAPNHSVLSENLYRDSLHPSRLGSQAIWNDIVQAVART